MTDATSSGRLTKTTIDLAQPRDRRYELWDAELAGFGIRIERSGVKTFVIRYRADGGGRSAPRRFMTVGRFGTLTVEQARKRARELLAAATVGDDPAGRRKSKRNELTVAALVDLYEREGCYIQRGKRQGMPMKPNTRQFTLARLRHHAVALLGHKRLSEVGPAEIERFFRDVETGKSAKDEVIGPRRRIIVRGGNGAARKAFRDLSAVFSFACRHGLVDSNPCERASVNKADNHRTRFLSLEELARLGGALDELEAEGANAKAIRITRLWALTGCRRQEIAELRWSEVDFERGLLCLQNTKTGHSTRPLAKPALDILRSVEPTPDCDYVFPADTGDSFFQGTKKIWSQIVKRAGLPGVTPHTLRHTLGAIATSGGEALAMTGAILGHANMRSTMIYAHVEMAPSQQAAERVAARIAAALGTASDTEPAPAGESRAEPPARAVAPLLPEGEWEALCELCDERHRDTGFLASKDSPDLKRLARRGLCTCEPGPAAQLGWWRPTKVGTALAAAPLGAAA